ncbi:MAG: 4-hydroxybenzoate octaprenyltransferase [Maricaulaceae bacterium]
MAKTIKDTKQGSWVNRRFPRMRPYFQLSRLDRPVGYWLLTLPGWMAIAFAGLRTGLEWEDIRWAVLILIGAVAMRGAGCTYNDIVDQDLDAKVDRTQLRPLPAGTTTTLKAWIWLAIQCLVGLWVLLKLPLAAQIISLCSLPLVAGYPFMKRITWWPQAWLGLTFNWAALVVYGIKTGGLSPGIIALYLGMALWTVFYDTIYACQDIEDDAIIGVKSTARLFGDKLIQRLTVVKILIIALFLLAFYLEDHIALGFIILPFAMHLNWQRQQLKTELPDYLSIFKSNMGAAVLFIFPLTLAIAMDLFT